MDKLQKVKIILQESKRYFLVIFNQTFGFSGLIHLMGILMEEN
ncbi:hypothetical protein NIES4072_43370 [Nostoc commune NIES-4072]|uniref:Uncharacterized protein n=1 Tax=Nostoc commune NIES-4072 TaxID=2005467 RepID=A0A2R5FPG5_NOSCO|nr:hypothetical protein NIES4070_47460 [Nostoc commune HK-02]GBG20656.1 hypothetical protein NIES4072_43370 [Nostoc commune NIES-4072]